VKGPRLKEFLFKRTVLAFITFLLAFKFWEFYREMIILEDSEKKKILTLAKAVANVCIEKIVTEDYVSLKSYLDELVFNSWDINRIVVVDSNGTVVADTDNVLFGEKVEKGKFGEDLLSHFNFTKTWLFDELIGWQSDFGGVLKPKWVGYPLVYVKQHFGILLMHYNPLLLRSRVKQLYFYLFLEVLLGILLAFFLASEISKRLQVSMQTLMPQALRVANRDLHSPIIVPRTELYEIRALGLVLERLRRRLVSKIEELKKRLEEFEALLRVSEMILNAGFELQTLLWNIVLNVAVLLRAKRCSIVLEENGKKVVKVAKGFAEGFVENFEIKDSKVLDKVFETGEAILMRKSDRNSDKYESGDFMIVPLFRDGKVIGTLNVADREDGKFFTQDDIRLLKMFAGYAGIALKHAFLYGEIARRERLTRDVELAKQIQDAMLPQEELSFRDVHLVGSTTPARVVGGDYFDYFVVDDKVLFVIADVSGKGVPAALLGALCKGILKSHANYTTSPADLVKRLNSALSYDLTLTGAFVTIFIGELSFEDDKWRLRYTAAAHEPAFVISDGEFVELEVTGGLVGPFATAEFKEKSILLGDKFSILGFTDGITETINEKGEFFGKERLMNIFKKYHLEVDKFREELFKELSEFRGEQEQIDDITFVLVRRLSGSD